jgi:hypothetical protein
MFTFHIVSPGGQKRFFLLSTGAEWLAEHTAAMAKALSEPAEKPLPIAAGPGGHSFNPHLHK